MRSGMVTVMRPRKTVSSVMVVIICMVLVCVDRFLICGCSLKCSGCVVLVFFCFESFFGFSFPQEVNTMENYGG